jgi:hypothetical protein
VSGIGDARIKNPGDVRMIHQRERLAFSLEPGNDLPRVHAQLDDLERHTAADRLFLLGHVNDAATAFADFLEQLVTANSVAGFFGRSAGL